MTDHPLDITHDVVEGIPDRFVGHGLAFGKFMPPTNGHIFFLNFARASCRRLTILVLSLPTEPIPGELRFKWIKELFPDCNVVHHYIDIPQEPRHPQDLAFFETWRDSIHKHCPGEKFDALFASEPYGYKVASVMGIRFVPVNVKRDLVQISGTAMRENPLRHWEHLHPVVRPYFLKRVAIVGPAGSGKSTLAARLSTHFGTMQVAEYRRALLADYAANIPDFTEAMLDVNDVSTVARGQIAAEEALARQANRVLFSDTELLSVKGWSLKAFGQSPAWLDEAIPQRRYDLYLLLKAKGADFDAWKEELERRKLRFAVIEGDSASDKFQKALSAIVSAVPELKSEESPLRVAQ